MNDERFTSIFTRLASSLKLTAGRILGNDESADDALQDAFCRLWGLRGDFNRDGEVERMARVTVRNLCIDSYRRRSVHPHQSLDDTPESMAAAVEPTDTIAETYSQVTRLIEQALSERDRKVLFMRDRDGWEFDEIAQATGLSVDNVRVIVSRARRTVRQLYNCQNRNN